MHAGWTTLALVAGLLAAQPAGAQLQALHSADSEVRFDNGGVQLTGWLEMPAGANTNVPVVILVGGNSASWRAYDWMFHVMADSLLRANIGVFYYDHRGDNRSQGSWAFSSYEELAGDVVAAAEKIAGMPRVDARRIGVWGHSMGGWIAPLAATLSPRLAFVITAAGPAVSPLVQTAYDHLWQDIARGVPRTDAIEMDALRRDLWAYYTRPVERERARAQRTLEWAKTRPWYAQAATWRELQGVGDSVPGPGFVQSARFDTAIAELRRDAVHDPTSALQRLTVPMLALFGGADRVVPNEISIAALRSAFETSGNSGLRTHVFPGANHSLLTGRTRDAAAFAPGYLRLLADWINAVPPRAVAAPEPPQLTYQTKVTLGAGTCPDARVEDHPTTTRLTGNTILLTHAGQTYTGTMNTDQRFTTNAALIDAGDTRYRLTISGTVDATRLEADVTVEKQSAAGAAICSYVVHWSGRR